MAGYDLIKTGANTHLSREKLEHVVDILEQIAAGKTLKQLDREGVVDMRNFYKIIVEYPDVAKAFAIAREMSGYSLEDKALGEAERLIAPNDFNGTKVKAIQVAMEQWRWSAARRNKKEFGETSGASVVVPIQINTTLDIGQPGAKASAVQDNVYEFAAKFEEAEVEPLDKPDEPAYTPPDEPVPGSAKFGITEPPKSVLPKNKGGRPPGKGHHKDLRATEATKAAYRQRKPRNGTAKPSGDT